MHKQYINYDPIIPLSISYETIINYPIHWHYSIEIIYVIEGTVDLYIDSEKYTITEDQIEIINIDEVHSLESHDPNNKILIFQFDPYFFEKYYSDIDNMLFYTKSSQVNAQLGEEYDELREFLAQILCESVQKQDNYDEEIENILVKLLYHLINNFNYLIYEKEELKFNKDQLQRYHSISKYIYNNFEKNLTLQDISNKEYLSTHYLSREIKYSTGYSFTEYLNLIRVRESIKLLLDTDLTLSEISDEIGFSHSRYFNKHFKIHYDLTPLQFRKKFKASDSELKKLTKFVELPIESSLQELTYYLEDYERYNYEDKIYQLIINMAENLSMFNKDFNNVITISDAFDLLIEDNKDTLEELQGELGFKFGRILNLFSSDMAIFPNSKFHNWNRCKDVLEFIDSLGIIPIIVLSLDESYASFINVDKNNTCTSEDANFILTDYKSTIHSFIEYFSGIDSLQYKNFRFQFTQDFPSTMKESIINIIEEEGLLVEAEDLIINNEVNNIYDTAYMIPFIIDNISHGKDDLTFLRAFDVLDKQVNLTNELFFGYPGLINDKGIKKPSFYAYFLLNKLGDELVKKGDGYIVTKSSNQYQILLYTYHEDIDKLISAKSLSKLKAQQKSPSKKIALNLSNIHSDINITTYEINEKIGSSFNYWLDMGKPKRLNKTESGILHKASYPSINFKHLKKSMIVNMLINLKSYGATLIIINEV